MHNEEKQLDERLRELFSELPLEEPSDGFTRGVLKQLETSPSQAGSKYAPLFSRTGWILVISLVVILLVSGFLSEGSGSYMPDSFVPEFIDVFNATESYLPQIGSSEILVYSLLALILCFTFQVLWFKNSWFKRRMAI
ncbi:MAG: hypothetical protein HKO75_06640 [Flavobacteriaceae bacterium]|nr:hypothetical protein [Muriicola sp.]MBT8290535.1 hypothetical protein [Muriicola sp.]NNC61390.1 hypothetical protein [Eudoraea sp.]NNK35731.1 hypothetical protein [Eudoraea sp.]NNL39523.1 hypothetical protein [Flavobacteriaceae bacterium]